MQHQDGGKPARYIRMVDRKLTDRDGDEKGNLIAVIDTLTHPWPIGRGSVHIYGRAQQPWQLAPRIPRHPRPVQPSHAHPRARTPPPSLTSAARLGWPSAMAIRRCGTLTARQPAAAPCEYFATAPTTYSRQTRRTAGTTSRRRLLGPVAVTCNLLPPAVLAGSAFAAVKRGIMHGLGEFPERAIAQRQLAPCSGRRWSTMALA
jgi:hypothetical protein